MEFGEAVKALDAPDTESLEGSMHLLLATANLVAFGIIAYSATLLRARRKDDAQKVHEAGQAIRKALESIEKVLDKPAPNAAPDPAQGGEPEVEGTSAT